MQKKLKTKTITFRPTLFWDVDVTTIDPQQHAKYIIRRMMSLGNDAEVQWMWRTYPRNLLRDVALHSRGVDARARTLWTLLTKKR